MFQEYGTPTSFKREYKLKKSEENVNIQLVKKTGHPLKLNTGKN